jgi:hypothetical protein
MPDSVSCSSVDLCLYEAGTAADTLYDSTAVRAITMVYHNGIKIQFIVCIDPYHLTLTPNTLNIFLAHMDIADWES